MSRADELLQIYGSKKKKEETKNRTRDLYNAYSSMSSEKETPHYTVDFRSRVAPMIPTARDVDFHLNHEANQKAVETQRYINSSPSVAVAPKSQTKYPAIEESYKSKIAEINAGKQDQSVKDSYLAEAQLEREVGMLEERARNQAIIDEGIPGVFLPKNQYNAEPRKNFFASNESEDLAKVNELLEKKRKDLKRAQYDNEIYRVFDDPEMSQELETMYANRNNSEVTTLYGKKLTERGYDAEDMLKRYTAIKTNETLSNPEISALVGAMADEEISKENTALLSLLNPSYAQSSSFSNAMEAMSDNETTFSKAYEARQKLTEMGYNPDELLEQYIRNQNKEVSESLNQEFREFGSKHPVLGTIASFPANLGSGMGVAALAKAALTGREVDPNSPYFTYLNMTQNMRQGASGGMSKKDKFAYDISTTIGDMVLSKHVAGGNSKAYSAIMASQAAASTAQDGAEKGYSTGHIFINATASAALTAVCEHLGYDKVFNPQTASTAKELFKNMLKGFLAEGLEEASEETLNTLVENVTSAAFEGQSDINKRIGELVAQGMTEEDAKIQAVSEIAERVGTSFVVGGFAGSLMSGANSARGYVGSIIERQLNKNPQNPTSDIQPPTADVNNALNSAPEAVTDTAPETVTGDIQTAATGEISASNNEFDNLYDNYVEEDIEQPSDEVDTTVGEDGTVYFEFDDDTDFEAVNEEIKTEYDTEEKADLAEITEPYSSGNAAVDAMLNPNGKLDRKITVDEQAENKLVDMAQRWFNRKVRFVDTYTGGNGYYDKNTGEIVIARDSDKKYVTVFGHEFLHSLEGTHGYDTLTTFLKHNSPYIKNKVAEFGSWEALQQNKITEYENALGVKLTPEEAEYEIFADAIADEFFSDYKTIESLATQNRSLFTKLKQWFYTNVVKMNDQTRVYGNKAAARKTYALMLRAEKAAKGGVQSGEFFDKKYSIRNITANDGKEFENVVVLDTDIFDNAKPRNWGKKLQNHVYNKLAGQQVVASDKTIIEFARYSEKVQKNDAKNPHRVIDKLARKTDRNSQLAVAHSNEIIEVMSPGESNSENSHQWLDENGWKFYKVNLMQSNGDIFEATINVAKTRDERNILYDINKIKRIGHGDVFSKGNSPQGTRNKIPNSAYSISESAENVNGNLTQSQQFKNWFGDWQSNPESSSKIVNADGTPKVMYHGTPAQFTVFDKKKAKSSGFYGRGFYFTDSESHSNQYGNSMAVYLDVKNPLTPGENSISKQQLRKFLEAVAANEDDYDIWNYGTENLDEIANKIYKNDAFAVIQDVNATAIGDFAESLRLFNEVNGTSFDGIVTPTETVVFEPTQIKSATDNIGTFDRNNPDIRYSAKKPEIIDKLKNDFGYSEASANNIYRAARTMKQSAGSTADIEQLTSEIVVSLNNRRNGEIDNDNINRIAMMLTENAQAVNETYVSEYKPIMDYLKGTKISISETDISDLGDTFSYVKGKLFPTVTLAKEGGTPVDTVFQELSAKFPNTFNADEITHPADQVKAISGFIEEYRDNYYFKPYFEGDEAYTQLRDTVSELVNDKLIDNSTYLKRLAEMKNTYGELKNGVPKSTDGETRVRRTEASYYGSDAVQNSPERVERFTRDFVNGKHDYKVLRVGKEAMTYINNIKASENVVETVKNEYSALRRKLTDKNYRIQPDDIVKAAALNPLLGDILTDDDYVEYTMLAADVATTAGQIVSSLKLISQFSGAQKLRAYHKKLDQINAKRAKNYQGEPDAYAVADENGQFKMPDDSLSQGKSPSNKTPKGFIELTVAKKQSKYPPIEIPARLEAELAKAKSQAEIDAATDKINKYLAEQIHPTWFERFDAWQYFAMLSNPKTAVRNTVGNVAMGATSRMKDVIAAVISASPLANKYKDGSVQTTAVKTTKEARKAATRLLVESDNVFDLFSNQDKYTGRVNEFEQGEAKLNKIEQKIAERNPLLDTIYHKRTIQPTALASSGRAIIDKPLGKLSDLQQKMLDDTLFKTLRAKSVLAQSITQAVKKGDIENLDDFLAVALNGNTDNIDNATKIHYMQLFDTISKQAAKEGDEATFREDNKFADALNKFEKNLEKSEAMPARLSSIVVKSLVRFKKTPANIVKRGYEYSPIALGVSLVSDRVKLAKGEIDRNTYINNVAKGLTGTGIFAIGALLSSLGILNIGDDDEEDAAERKLLGGQNYSLNVGDGTYTIDFLSPAALPLFMGGKVYETVVSVLDGDEIKATEFMLDVMQGIAEPMFAQTMLDGIDGAFEAISRNSAYSDTEGASFIALMNYCAENWAQQFVPSFLGGIARTADDTVRSYYNEPGKDEGLLDNLMVGIKKKVPGAASTTPAKLDMWGQPISTGSLAERLIENFISPGYYQENTSDRATKALHTFATNNGIAYTDIIPKKPNNYFTLPNKTEITLTAEEYEKYAGIIGRARKEAVEKYLVQGASIEIEYNYTKIKSSLKSGRTTDKRTFRGNIATATNRYGWASTKSADGYIQFDDNGKAISVTPASNEEFRKMLFDEVMKQATDKAEAQAQEAIMKDRNK